MGNGGPEIVGRFEPLSVYSRDATADVGVDDHVYRTGILQLLQPNRWVRYPLFCESLG